MLNIPIWYNLSARKWRILTTDSVHPPARSLLTQGGEEEFMPWDPLDPRRDRDPREPDDSPKRDEPWNDPDDSPLEQPPEDDPEQMPEDEPPRRDPDTREPPMQVLGMR